MQTKLFVRNVAWNTTNENLTEAFSKFGTVVKIDIARDASTGHNRGFAFVEMETQVAAEAAVRNLDMRELDGRQLSVRLADAAPKKGSGSRRRR